MHANTLAGRVALALGVFAPAALAQQTTVVSGPPGPKGPVVLATSRY